MKTFILTIATLLIITIVGWGGYLWWNIGDLQYKVEFLIEESQVAMLNADKWESIVNIAEELPNGYPLSKIRNSFIEAQKIITETDKMIPISNIGDKNKISRKEIEGYFENIKKIQTALIKIEKNINTFPEFLLKEKQIEKKKQVLEKLKVIKDIFSIGDSLNNAVEDFFDNSSRVLILLQNPNEPRPTGGFTGSMFVIDFEKEEINWKFTDTYSLDRKIPLESQIPAPSFFHGLSKTISLRDANFYPDFPTSAKNYQHFFSSINEKIPEVVVAIQQTILSQLLSLTGSVKLEKWDIEVNEHNSDLALQFLLGSKIEGKYGVKKPLLDLTRKLFTFKHLKNITLEELFAFDFQELIDQKSIQAYTANKKLQSEFKKWDIEGKMEKKESVDNYLYLDFISIGANKSEKFMWTKAEHNSLVKADGTVLNTLYIKRSHALHKGEIEDLLNTNKWTPNVKSLLTNDLKWVLGEGENKTIIRVYIPKDSKLISSETPSGKISQNGSFNGQFKILEIPAFVVPGESIEIKTQYETQLTRGSFDYRPYYFQLRGTPGKQKTQFLKTISTEKKGKFTAETFNLGRPVPLIDQNYRVLVEFTH